MHDIIQFALLGLGAGAAYTLLGQGVVLIYRASGVVNFAQGAFAMFGAFAFVELRKNGWSYAAAMIAAALMTALIGVLVQQVIMRRLRNAAPLVRVIATLGVLAVLQSIGTLRYSSTLVALPISLPHKPIKIGGIVVPEDRLWLCAIAALLTLALFAVANYSPIGRATSAIAENEVAAAALGWSPDLIASLSWAVGGALAAVAGILLVPLSGLSVTVLTFMIVPALATALIGGFASFPLTFVGGLAIGIVQSEMNRYVSTPGWPQAVPFLAIMLVLVVRGRGLPLRAHLIERLPDLGTGRFRPTWAIATAVVLAILLKTSLPVDWVADITVSLVAAIFLLSIVVLTGYAGQLSLAQFALGGIGALFTGRLVQSGWPFEAGLVVGVLGTAAVGLVLGLPALRTRGVNLAVVTLGLGSAVQVVVFGNPSYIGGPSGTQVGPQKFLGIRLDFVTDPRTYSVVVLAFVLLASWMVCNIRSGRSGRRLISVRTNERAAASLGVSVFESKLYAFSVSAGLAGLAGILYAFRGYTVVYSDFEPFHSITAVTLAVVGGIGYVVGASLGSLIAVGGFGVIISNAIFGANADSWLALVGAVLLILILLQNPNGLAKANSDGVAALRSLLLGRAPKMLGRFGTDRVGSRAESDPPAAASVGADRGIHRVKPAALTVEGLSVRFGGVIALQDVSLTVQPGQIVGLIGPNGAGKSTFIDAVTGFVRPSAGSVTLGQQRVDRLPAYRRSRAGLTRSFQSLELFDDVTVGDNLRAASDARDSLSYLLDLGWPRDPGLPAAAVAAIEAFGLETDLGRRPGELSYGRRRLVSIARSVATEPSVLMLDEPAAGLSEAESAELALLVRRLADDWGIAVLLIEHDMSIVMQICDQVTVLEYGSVIASGTPQQVQTDPAVVAAYLGSTEEDVSRGASADSDSVPALVAES